jgi:hypothetical protein
MQKILVIAAFLAASLLTMAASAAEQAAKPTDPQIAHIVYTANLLDIEAAKQALQKSKKRWCPRLCPTDGRRSYDGEQSSIGAGEETQRQAGRQSDEPKPEEGGGRHP